MKMLGVWKGRRRARAGFAVVLAGIVAGCGFDLNPAAKARLYHLEPDVHLEQDVPTSPSQLVIAVPETSRALDTDRVAVRKGNFELSYFSDVRWSDRAPRLIQTYLLESFENSGRITAVGRRAVGLDGNYALQGELWDFQVEMKDGGKAREVVVAFNAKLIEQPVARIVSSRTFSRRVSIQNDRFNNIVTGFNQALGDILPDLTAWTLNEMETHRIRKEQERENMMRELDAEAAEAAGAARRQLNEAMGEAREDEEETDTEDDVAR